MVDTCVPKIIFSLEGFWDLVRLYVGYCTIRSHTNKIGQTSTLEVAGKLAILPHRKKGDFF